MENQIYNILNDMAEFLNVMQMKKLQKVLIYHLNEAKQVQEEISNEKYLEMFLTAKQIEGCSDRTIQYYRVTIEHMLKRITIPLRQIATEDIRQYLIDYQKINNCGKVTIDNIRRNLSSFFSWLEEEDHILKSPVKRIHKIKTKTVVKEVISDESIEILRDNCKEKRDLAIIDLLFSTGMRVGELVNLDIADIDFNERECIVYGKGDKERRVYFDARAKLHLQNYLKCRTDDNPALFVTLNDPHKRLKISGVEIRLMNVMEAHQSLMELENIRILKDMRNTVNRKVNCETANINKTVSAAVKQIEDIRYIEETKGLDKLPEGLKDMALTRLTYPEASLKELGALLQNPVGKSGVNHRLRKLSEMAEEIRAKQGGTL